MSVPFLPAEVLQAIKAGRSIIPIRLNKKPAIDSWKEFQERPPSVPLLIEWAAKKPPAWAQITGKVSRLVTFDFDGDIGIETMHTFSLPPHRRTGSGGYHVDVEYPAFHVPTLNGKAKAELGQRWPGLDVKGDGGYAVIGGRNKSGAYAWLRPLEPYPVDVIPAELWDFLTGADQPAPAVMRIASLPPYSAERVRPEA